MVGSMLHCELGGFSSQLPQDRIPRALSSESVTKQIRDIAPIFFTFFRTEQK